MGCCGSSMCRQLWTSDLQSSHHVIVAVAKFQIPFLAGHSDGKVGGLDGCGNLNPNLDSARSSETPGAHVAI